ncbi:hypothetical protein ACU686_15210 [Yinghuangia aomiensis]
MRKQAPEFVGDGAVEDRDGDGGLRRYVGHGKGVAQGGDVVVQEDGHPVGRVAERGAQLAVARLLEVVDGVLAGLRGRADAAGEVGLADDHEGAGRSG